MEAYEPLIQNLPPLNTILNLTYYVLLGFFALFTAIIYYHWTNYALEKSVARITLITYMICTLPLLLIMGGIILII
jgi:hypothetical protein